MPSVLASNRVLDCGIPVDADYFDVSGFVGGATVPVAGSPTDPFDLFNLQRPDDLPRRGEQRLLASFQLHAQYCGVLTHFAQFTDLYAADDTQILTPGFEWVILQNGKPVFPYVRLEMIVNPWGCNCLPIFIRLDENARVEFVIRNRSIADAQLADYPIKAFAGRIMGRYWYNESFGGR